MKTLEKKSELDYNIKVLDKNLILFDKSLNCREVKQMSEVRVRENESLDSALRRFKRQCAMSGIMSEVRKREHYDKPSVKRKKKAEAARRKNAKR